MITIKKLALLPQVFYFIFFASVFLYFLLFNRYHLAFQEQIQLFRYDWDYFKGFLDKPGGISFYLGAFISQFFIIPFVGPVIVTSAAIVISILSVYTLRKHSIKGVLWSVPAVLFIVALHSDYLYNIGYSIGFILSLSLIAVYFSIRKDKIRYLAGFLIMIFLHFAAGGFSLMAASWFIIHELLYTNRICRYFVALGYIMMTVFFPYFSWHYLYYITLTDAWLYPVLFPYDGISKFVLVLLLAYLPVLLIIIKIWLDLSKKAQFIFDWNWKTVPAGMIIILTFFCGINKYSYDRKTEALFKTDYYVQHSDWEKALKQAANYPGRNRLITCFANLSLYKSGQLSDSFLLFNHTGMDDLWLEWPGGKLSLFFGSEIFYHLGYFNEAYRRAYDAMVLTGQNPRSLKALAKISIVNGNLVLAQKYLEVLEHTLFYRKWARNYQRLIQYPDLLEKDQEIMEKRVLLLVSDFLVDTNEPDKTLLYLLQHHPDNRMAYEYFMAALLLGKNLTAFTTYLPNLKSYPFKEIPVHYEEAMLVYMSQTQKNIVPEGYKIRETTIRRFKDYFNKYSNARSSSGGDPGLMEQMLYDTYGKTYWYYLHFTNTKMNIR